MAEKYGYCLVCANSQKDLDICALCGSGYVIARDVTDYEVHLFDQVKIDNHDQYDNYNPEGEKPGQRHEKPGEKVPNDPKYHPAPSSLPPANRDKRFIGSGKDVQDTKIDDQDPLKNKQTGDRKVVDQVRETWTRTGDPKTTKLTLYDKNVQNVDVDPKNYSTKNDGHERPDDAPKAPGKAIPAPVGGSMDKDVNVAVYPGKPYPLTPEKHDTFMDPHAGGDTKYQELADTLKTPPSSETQKFYPGNPTAKPYPYMDPFNNAFWEAEEADLLVKSERKTKTVGGQHLTADKFACVGDAQRTETWKLPIHDANHVRNALARFTQAEGCNTPTVRAKILRAAKRFGINAESLQKAHEAYYQDDVKKETKNDSFMDPGPIGTPDPVVTDKVSPPALPKGDPEMKGAEKMDEDQPGATKADVEKDDYAHPKQDVDTRNLKEYKKGDGYVVPPTASSPKRQTPDGNVDEADNYPPGKAIPSRTAKTEANPAGAAPPAPIEHDSFMDPHTQGTPQDPRMVKNDFKDNLKDKKDLKDSKADNMPQQDDGDKGKVSTTADNLPNQGGPGDGNDGSSHNKLSTQDPQTIKNPAPTKKITDDQARKARREAIAKMQTYLKPSDNFPAPKKKGNVDMMPNIGLDEEKPNYSRPTFLPHKDSDDMQKDDKTSVSTLATKASGVPTTRTPQGDNINDHYVEITDKDGAPIRTVPSAENLSTQYGVVTPRVRTDENRTVVIREGDTYVGDGDKPGDSTTRGPDADRVDTNRTLTLKDVTKEQSDLEQRKVVGFNAIKTLRFAKSFWKSTDAVLAFLVNEAIWNGYQVDASGKIVTNMRDTGGYFELDALPADQFKPGTFADHCIASFGGDCAIIATIGEVASTPEPTHLPYGDRVKNLAAPAPITKAFADHYIKRTAYLEGENIKIAEELRVLKSKLEETEGVLATALKDKKTMARDYDKIKSELDEKIAEARLTARLDDLPGVVKAQLKRNSHKDEIIDFLRTANDAEWELARRTFALAKHKSFTELSEEEGKLPVGGGSTNDTKTLQEYLR